MTFRILNKFTKFENLSELPEGNSTSYMTYLLKINPQRNCMGLWKVWKHRSLTQFSYIYFMVMTFRILNKFTKFENLSELPEGNSTSYMTYLLKINPQRNCMGLWKVWKHRSLTQFSYIYFMVMTFRILNKFTKFENLSELPEGNPTSYITYLLKINQQRNRIGLWEVWKHRSLT